MLRDGFPELPPEVLAREALEACLLLIVVIQSPYQRLKLLLIVLVARNELTYFGPVLLFFGGASTGLVLAEVLRHAVVEVHEFLVGGVVEEFAEFFGVLAVGVGCVGVVAEVE